MLHIVTRKRAGSSAYAEDTFKVVLSFVNLLWARPSQGADDLLGTHVEEDQQVDAEDQVREPPLRNSRGTRRFRSQSRVTARNGIRLGNIASVASADAAGAAAPKKNVTSAR